jgi:hypothetical protein
VLFLGAVRPDDPDSFDDILIVQTEVRAIVPLGAQRPLRLANLLSLGSRCRFDGDARSDRRPISVGASQQHLQPVVVGAKIAVQIQAPWPMFSEEMSPCHALQKKQCQVLRDPQFTFYAQDLRHSVADALSHSRLVPLRHQGVAMTIVVEIEPRAKRLPLAFASQQTGCLKATGRILSEDSTRQRV